MASQYTGDKHQTCVCNGLAQVYFMTLSLFCLSALKHYLFPLWFGHSKYTDSWMFNFLYFLSAYWSFFLDLHMSPTHVIVSTLFYTLVSHHYNSNIMKVETCSVIDSGVCVRCVAWINEANIILRFYIEKYFPKTMLHFHLDSFFILSSKFPEDTQIYTTEKHKLYWNLVDLDIEMVKQQIAFFFLKFIFMIKGRKILLNSWDMFPKT